MSAPDNGFYPRLFLLVAGLSLVLAFLLELMRPGHYERLLFLGWSSKAQFAGLWSLPLWLWSDFRSALIAPALIPVADVLSTAFRGVLTLCIVRIELLLSMPVIGLLFAVALIDGRCARAVRRDQRRDSSSVHGFFGFLLRFAAAATAGLWLFAPVMWSSAAILSAALLLAFSIRQWTATFKQKL